MSTPVIGITLDREEPGGYSKFPWYALRENYCRAVSKAGGLPVLLPHEPDRVEDYLAQIDGLIVSGGAFDVDPALFGAAERHPTVTTKDAAHRLRMDDHPTGARPRHAGLRHLRRPAAPARRARRHAHPAHPGRGAGALAHEQPNPRDEPGHRVRIVAGTLLHRIVGSTRLRSTAPIIRPRRRCPSASLSARRRRRRHRGIEEPRRRFCIGVQWHPEFEISEGDRRLFAAFVDAAR